MAIKVPCWQIKSGSLESSIISGPGPALKSPDGKDIFTASQLVPNVISVVCVVPVVPVVPLIEVVPVVPVVLIEKDKILNVTLLFLRHI